VNLTLDLLSLGRMVYVKEDYKSIRHKASQYMREHENDFKPFIDLEKYAGNRANGSGSGELSPAQSAEAYSNYCDIVQSSSEWGGHLELLALSHSLRCPIRVHSAENPQPLLIGWEEYGSTNPSPYEICYHLHYYALGEHYNSTVLL
jgi:OTU domain-containing protein 6